MNEKEQKTILLVEDEILIAMMEQQTIEKFGYRVILAVTGEEALDIVEKTPGIDLIIFDIDLGKGMTGPEAAAQILKNRTIPIVFLTSHSERDMVEKVRGITRYGYVIKNSGDFVLQSSIEMAFELFDANTQLKDELSARTRAEKAAHEADLLLHTVLSNAPITIFAIDNNGIFTLSEGKGLAHIGLKPGENVGASAIDIYESQPFIQETGEVIPGRELIRRALAGETLTVFSELRGVQFDNHVGPIRDADGAIVGIVGVATDITEHKRAEEALRESRLQLESAIKASNTGLWDWDLRTNRVFFSGEWKRQIGYEDHEISNDFFEWRDRVHPDDLEKASSTVRSFIANPWPDYENIFRFRHKDGSYRWILAKASLINDDDGKPCRMLGSHVDITDRKIAEDALRESEYFFRESQRAAFIGSYKTDFITGFWKSSEVLDRIFGIDQNYCRSVQGWLDIVHPNDREMMDEYLLDEVIARRKPFNKEYRIVRRSDDEIRWVLGLGEVAFDDKGNISSMIGTIQDITEQKKTEFKLTGALAEAQRFREALDKVSSYVYLKDTQSRYIYANRLTLELFGCSAEELTGCDDARFFPPDTAKRLREVDSRVFLGEHTSEEIEVTDAQGNRRVYWEVKTPVYLESGKETISGLLGISTDITERKQMESAFQQSEKLFRTSLENIPDAFGMYSAVRDPSGHIVDFRIEYVNAAACEANHVSKAEQEGKRLLELEPSLWESGLFDEYCQVVETGAPLVKDAIEYADAYSARRCVFNVRAARFGDGIVANWLDITDQKHAEAALQAGKDSLAEAQRIAHIGNWDRNIVTNELRWSNEIYRIFGLQPKEFGATYEAFLSFVHPEDRERLQKSVQEAMLGRKPYSIDHRIVLRNGEVRHVHEHGEVTYDESGRPVHVIGTVQDITGRKLTEEALKFRNLILSTQQESSIDGILVVDGDGNIVSSNRRFAEMWGVPIEMMEAESDDPVLQMVKEKVANPEEFIGKVEQLYAAPEETSRDEIVLKDGRTFDRYSAPMLGAGREYYGRVWYFRDITERKRNEEKVKALLAEKELILKEVHHRIKNNMNTIRSLLALQAETMSDVAVIAALKDAGSRVMSMMVLYDKLYQSADFHEMPVQEYLPFLIDEIVSNFPNSGSIKIEKHIDDFILDAKSLSTLGIIMNELLTNIMKYAFSGRENGCIVVSASLKDQTVSLAIQDNGAGIPEGMNFENSAGFGLMLVGMLTRQLGGSLRMEREGGTKIVLEFEK